MKPDWQNKSYAKTSSPASPSTMNPKLKVGMSTLHSKISQANNNMPQAPKPVVRKFADGGSVRTRSADEIGDTNLRSGVVDPGSYDRRMKAGEENLNRLKSAVESVRSFFTRDKQAESSPSNITGDSGMKDSDVAKKNAMSGGMDFEKKAEPKAEVKAEVKAEEPTYKAAVVEAVTKPRAAVQDLPAAPAAAASSNAASSNDAAAAAAAAAARKAAAAKKAAEKKAAENKKKQANTNANSASAAASPSSSNVAKSFSEDVAKRRAGNMQPLSSSTAMFSDTMKSPPVPKDNRPKTDMKTTLQKGADAVSNYFSNFETPMQRRERERKEAKK
jgi:hypothetical protein